MPGDDAKGAFWRNFSLAINLNPHTLSPAELSEPFYSNLWFSQCIKVSGCNVILIRGNGT